MRRLQHPVADVGRLPASAALPCKAPEPGTDCLQLLFDHQNLRSLHSSASSRPTRSSIRPVLVAVVAMGVVYRRPAPL